MKNYWIFALKILVLLIVVVSCNKKTNLVKNPGFEDGEGGNTVGWIITIPDHAGSYQLGTDDQEARSGKKSYKLSRIWTYPRRSAVLKSEQPIPIEPQKKYLLSFWYKTRDINEYPESFSAQFLVECDSTPAVRYTKKIYNVDEWQEYFVLLDNIPFDAHQLALSFNTNISTKGSIWLDDISFREAGKKDIDDFEKWRRQPIPKAVGNAGDKQFAATGFFRVEKADDRWWVIDPDGNPTWQLAVSGSRGQAPNDKTPLTQVAWYSNRFAMTYEEVNQRLYSIFMDECGFNSFAGWTADEHAQITKARYLAGKPYMPMTRVLGLASALREPDAFAKDRDGNLRDRSGHEVPDPFNPEWREAAREKAERQISAYKDEPWFFGWFVDNEMSFDELYRYIWAAHSSKEFIKGLENKYQSIDALNRAWSSKFKKYEYASFADILVDKPEPKEWDDPAWVDFAAFERKMLKEYIDYTYNLVKELDPNHIVISNRINLGPMPDIYRTADLWGKYDIVCMNIYPDNNKIGFNQGELEIMKKLHEGTGRPIIIGEWSVPSIDSDLYKFGPDPHDRPLDWSWPQVLRTQQERAEAYEICIKQLASLDFMIGAGWFITFDVDTPIRRANRGLMTKNYELYTDLTNAMKKAHDEIKKEMGLKW